MKQWNSTKRLWLVLLACALTLLAALPAAAAQGDWLVRLRAISVDPNSSSGEVHSNGVAIAGSGVTVDDDVTFEIDITYMLRDNWGLELIAGSSKHDVAAEGSLGALGEILSTRTLPPTLTLQYHFAPDGKVRPYLGLGVNYTLFFNEEATEAFEAAAGGSSDVDLDGSLGLSGQFGLDIGFSDKWFLNFDVKYVTMGTDATITTPGPLGVVTVDVDIDPWIYGVGIGWRL